MEIKSDQKYIYKIDPIIDEIMKDAGIFGPNSPKPVLEQEVSNIVKFIKNKNKDLNRSGQKIDIKEFARRIFERLMS